MRPILRLIQSNPESSVVEITTTAFSATDIKEAFATLLALKGVGPATASYLLAAQKFPKVPVFSDEAFRWVVYDGDWDVKIKYDAKEYWKFYAKVDEVAKRLGVTADDVERVGFVVGREAARGEVEDGRHSQESAKGEAPKGETKGNKSTVKGRAKERKDAESMKRKAMAGGPEESKDPAAKKPRAKKAEKEEESEAKASDAAATGSARILRSRKASKPGK
jgi:hypothetical protein